MNATQQAAADFIEAHVRKVRPLMRETNLAAWNAATTGSDEALARAAGLRSRLKKVYADRAGFERVRTLLASGELSDESVRRQLVLLDHDFTANQLPTETIDDLTARESELERHFYNFRARLDGEELSNNDLRRLLQTERDNDRRRSVWEASKGIGPLVAEPLLELVRRRNAAARDLGFPNYYSMELQLQEFDEEELFSLLEDFRRRSDEPFRALRHRLDAVLAERFDLSPDELRPWHWEDFFGQEAPPFGDIDLDPLFAPLDHEQIARDYFAAIDLPIDDVLDRSDLHERQGKDQHAFCTDIDRAGDVRILCNLRPDERWMGTLLHELGHAAYDKFLPAELPFIVRMPAHTLATESIAMYFGRLPRDPEWLRSTARQPLGPVEAADINEQQRLAMLVSARWMLVMINFERALYTDPDRPDLNRLWWDLVEELQLIRRPKGRDEPDWATKLHLSLAPVYYHNYLLGELMASQLTHAMHDSALAPELAGSFLRERIFAPGASLPWNDLLREATGEPLTGKYFVDQFVGAATTP
ncbi:MAG: M2 family metallopeptidase [Gemmatimonadota bacterium]